MKITTSEIAPNINGVDDSNSAVVEILLTFLRCMNEGVDIRSLIRSGSIFNCLCNLTASRSLL